ncbi:MAG: hypothetical protein AB7E81_22970 [Hyphomicrobiaceae bacterium]
MHTLMVMGGGVALLVLFALFGKLAGVGAGRLVLWFIPVWLVCAAFNMWVGISRAGYSFAEELPIFLLVFAVPAIGAAGIYWQFGR